MTRIAPQLSALAVPIDAVRPHPRNPNQGDVGSITTSLEQFAQYAPIVVQRSTGHIVKGNHTYLAARALGWTAIAANVMDLDDTEALAVLVGDNRHSELGTRDQDALGDLLTELAQADALLGTGYDGDDVDALLADLLGPTAGLTDPDAVPGVPDEPITQPGDLWVLGRHRLLCGDSTNPQHIDRLMDGQRAEMTITDPPYNVGIDYGDTTDDRNAAYLAFSRDWFVVCPSDGVVFTPGTVNLGLWYGIEAPKWVCIWRKTNQNSSSRLNGFNTWEPLLVYGKHPKPVGHDSWDIPVGMHDTDIGHPVPKTAAAWSVFVEAFSTDHALLYDPFLGSGTTLIAAEQLGRSCYGMEISPAYCDVIVSRWEAFTGGQAVRHG